MVKQWKLLFTNQAKQDAKKLKTSGLKEKAEAVLQIIKTDPFQKHPPYKKLIGDLNGCYSRRVNIQHRIVYQVDNKKHQIVVLGMFGHYQ